MKILHITDSHGTVKSPDSRTDLYYMTFLRKLAELKYIIQLEKIDMVIHTGDLFHISRVSNKLMGQVAEIVKTYEVPIYVVPGNHDIDGYTIDTIDQTSLGLLAKTRVITLLTRNNPFTINTNSSNGSYSVAISGQEYYTDIDNGNNEDFEMQQPEADINILAVHSYIADTQQHPNIRCTYPKDIITDADIILSGHYHRSFEMNVGDTSYYNPGSMLRVEMTDYNKKNMPQYGILDISLDASGDILYDYQFHKFRIAQSGSSVFDFASNNIIKSHGITLENFKNSITNTMQAIKVNIGATPLETIDNLIVEYNNKNTLSSGQLTTLQQESLNLYNQASQKIIDDDVMSTKGFIPSKAPIKLKSVELVNFQSHENTRVEFKDGLNVILGESNNGKTSIFRGIMWVIDNAPLGTNFIMTGKDWCKVILEYDNGTVIERYRTLKDTGYYKVTAFDDISNQMVTTEYKGFTNNVPVEVMNAHQMPKISITKNIDTHLNVMTQLERPFLLTESVNEKASAIGRITGTNVIDEAIKSNTSNLNADKKYIKTLVSEKVTVESEINSIPINAVDQLIKFYSETLTNVDSLFSTYETCEDIKQKFNIITNLVDKYSKEIKECETIIDNKTNVELSELKNKEIVKLLNLKSLYEKIVNDIKNMNSSIAENESVINNKSIIEQCNILTEKIKNFITVRNNYINITQQINNNKSNLESLNLKVQNKTNIMTQEKFVNKINVLIPLYERYTKLINDMDITKNEINKTNKNIKDLNASLNASESEMKAFVLSQGKCPCCGQSITETNVEAVINNFKH